MPKKTKKEKLLARYHKKLQMLENNKIEKTSEIISDKPIVKEIKESIIEVKETPKYFYSDLKKSLILIVFIIGVEVALYFAKLIK